MPIFDFSEFFVRTRTEENPNLGVLFELSINCKIKVKLTLLDWIKNGKSKLKAFYVKNTNEETELCCGWTHLPFVDPTTRTQIVNKNYDSILHGGSIYDRNIALDPETARTSSFRVFEIWFLNVLKLIYKKNKQELVEHFKSFMPKCSRSQKLNLMLKSLVINFLKHSSSYLLNGFCLQMLRILLIYLKNNKAACHAL